MILRPSFKVLSGEMENKKGIQCILSRMFMDFSGVVSCIFSIHGWGLLDIDVQARKARNKFLDAKGLSPSKSEDRIRVCLKLSENLITPKWVKANVPNQTAILEV